MTKFIKSKGVILLIIILAIFIVFSDVLALEVTWPPSPLGTKLTDESTLTELVKYLYEWGIGLGGLAAFIALIMAGFQYLTSMGEPARLADAKDRIRSAFFGLILLLGSWLILNTINPQLTTLQPIELNLKAIFTSCETDANCPQGYQCQEGICIPKLKETEEMYCTKVELYKGFNYSGGHIATIYPKQCINLSTGRGIGISPEESIGTLPPEQSIGISPGKKYSSKGFKNNKEDKQCVGILIFYSRRDCDDIIESVGATTEVISLGTDAYSVRFLASPK